MERWLVIELIAAGVGTAFLALLGWLMQNRKLGGAVLVGLAVILGSGLCILGTFVGRYVVDNSEGWIGQRFTVETGGWIGLIAGMLLAAVMFPPRLAGFARTKSRRPFVLAWLAVCVLCIAGYLLGNWPGLAMVPLTTIVILLWLLYRFSKHVLPLPEVKRQRVGLVRRVLAFLRDPQSGVQRLGASVLKAFRQVLTFLRGPRAGVRRLWALLRDHRRAAARRRADQVNVYRCVLTYLLGTNWPFYFVKDGKTETRVDGNPFRQFFAGPGFVYAEPDQAAYVTDCVKLTGICGPGLTFTQLYDQEVIPLDLRRQLRAFDVEALTSDGIRIRVLVFTPFRLYSAEKEAQLGGSFPFQRRTAHLVAQHEITERKRKKAKAVEKHTWNGGLVPLLTRPIVQDIVGRYSIDELSATLDPDRDPRDEIVREMQRRLRPVLRSYGIELIGGGISNLVPSEKAVAQRRLDNWKTEWERRVLVAMGKGRSERARHIEKARAQAELQILARLSEVARQGELSDEASQVALTLRFIDCLGEIVSETDAQWPLPESCRETLARLRGEIEEGQR